ncbi:ImuA family protein [Szabonella alba]|uniref:Protein ImuA n=1 Tax=Szabonella alba TaxID=2804194 RepID=A0A8K0V5Y8_9RHOB|nr:hypothetical protein [Szabonella alba]MBL4916359.1 hypothetical protein [Szabonella alba]
MFVEDLHKALRRGPERVAQPLLPPQYGVEADLLRGRVHEFCGPARRVLALLLMQAGALRGSGPDGPPATRAMPSGPMDGRDLQATPAHPADGTPPDWFAEPPPGGATSFAPAPRKGAFPASSPAPPSASVLWIVPGWLPGRLYPGGVAGFIDPGALILVEAPRAPDILWTMEEALRSGAVPLVVAELAEPPQLTPVRRLHLAAEAGMARRGMASAPLGLLLLPDKGGAPGVESRWWMEYRPEGWLLSRLRARSAPPRDWRLPLPTTELRWQL